MNTREVAQSVECNTLVAGSNPALAPPYLPSVRLGGSALPHRAAPFFFGSHGASVGG